MESVMEFKVDNPGTAAGMAAAKPAPAPADAEEVFAVDDPGVADKKQEGEDEPFQKQGVFEFNTPILMMGETVSSVRYDFTKIKPVDVIQITQSVGKRESVTFPQLNLSVQANVFCKAASLPPSVVKTQMGADDFMAACSLARDFLLSGRGARKEDDLI